MRTSITISALVASLIVIGCGSSSTTTDATVVETSTDGTVTPITLPSVSRVSGTVPGTLIEAFCADGSYISVTSTQNGTDQHPFEIELPIGVECHLVMTTNENDPVNKVITPISFSNLDSNTSGFILESATLELGHIPLAMAYSDINDSTGDHVNDNILIVEPLSGTVIKIEARDDLMDSDSDGLIDVYEDTDGDGIPNHDDSDDDGDGIPDTEDNDNDNDGISDNDDDGDGIQNNVDNDVNNDGVSDNDNSSDSGLDNDANDDGAPDNDMNDDGESDTVVDNNDSTTVV